MKKKTVLTLVLTALLLITCVILGITTVYRVGAVSLNISLISEDARTEADELEEKLAKEYKGLSFFSVNSEKAKEHFEEYPHFRLLKMKKDAPNRIIFEAVEDDETYAVECAEGYMILNSEGTYLTMREENKNRADGYKNVEIKGVTLVGEIGQTPSGNYFNELIDFCKGLHEALDGIRKNVISVTVDDYVIEARKFTFVMQEGVTVDVYLPDNNTEEKIASFIDVYSSLTTAERMSGEIIIPDVGNAYYQN